jgi:hypothetical protein
MNARLENSARAMAVEYPGLSLVVGAGTGGEVGVWRGVIQPVRTLAGLDQVLDDVVNERPIRVVGGEVRHRQQCDAVHRRHAWMDRPLFWRTRFELEVRYDGGRGDPRCWIRWPPVVTLQKPTPHVWSDGSVCPFMSSEGWDCDSNDVADFMGQVVVWLVKWMLWDQTGIWIGGQHRADPGYHLSVVQPGAPCWCRSGIPYRDCHLAPDRRTAASRQAQMAVVLTEALTPVARMPRQPSDLL